MSKTSEATLISLETVPVINSNGLKGVGDLIEKRIKALNIDGQIATLETVKTLKTMKSSLNKEFKAYEEQRTALSNAIADPYKKFMVEYNVNIKDKYTTAIPKLTEKISLVENTVKNEKEALLKEFFIEYCQSKNVDFVTFDKVGLKVNLSATEKSLKLKITSFIDGCANDINVINALSDGQDYKDDVLIEYKSTLNLGISLEKVKTRSEAKLKLLEQQKTKRAEQANKLVEEEINKVIPPEPLKAPLIESPSVVEEIKKEEEFTANFSATATKEKLGLLKAFLIDNNISYKSI